MIQIYHIRKQDRRSAVLLAVCILKTAGSGGSKKLSLCPNYLSERSEEPNSLLLREKGDRDSGG